MSVNEILKKFPFISVIKTKKDGDFLGIILVQNKKRLYFYDVNHPYLNDENLLKLLDLGRIWWNESNRKLPISLFLKNEMIEFEPCLHFISNKFISDIKGPTVCLYNLKNKQNKKVTINL